MACSVGAAGTEICLGPRMSVIVGLQAEPSASSSVKGLHPPLVAKGETVFKERTRVGAESPGHSVAREAPEHSAPLELSALESRPLQLSEEVSG